MSAPLRRLGAVVIVAAAGFTVAGCESSQSRSADLQRAAGANAPAEQGVSVATASTTISAAGTTVLTDENGTAVIVELRNKGRGAAHDVPIQLTLRDNAGTELFTNTTAGLQRSLTHASTVAADGASWWVNDQIPLTTPAQAEVVVGDPTGSASAPAVRFTPTEPVLEEDPASGLAAVGKLRHDGTEAQQRVLVTVVARKGGRVVAAGRAIVARVKAKRSTPYTAFFIGDPRGAELLVSAELSGDTE